MIFFWGEEEGLQNEIINQSNKNDKAFVCSFKAIFNLFSRLTANIRGQNRNNIISGHPVQNGKRISPVVLGRLMVKLYPEVQSKRERLKSEWNKRESVFDGVKWRVEDDACSLEFLDILQYTETCFF